MLAVRPEISVVVPVFNERECLAEMCERCSAALALTGRRWELVFVDDGLAKRFSPDLLAGKLYRLSEKLKRAVL